MVRTQTEVHGRYTRQDTHCLQLHNELPVFAHTSLIKALSWLMRLGSGVWTRRPGLNPGQSNRDVFEDIALGLVLSQSISVFSYQYQLHVHTVHLPPTLYNLRKGQSRSKYNYTKLTASTCRIYRRFTRRTSPVLVQPLSGLCKRTVKLNCPTHSNF